MLVSIITATYNSEETIEETYKSLCNQSVSDWEWLVTDDCSIDSTFKILRNISKGDTRVKVFANETNSGAAVSRNRSLDNASGTFIAFIDSDDLWEPNKLEVQISYMSLNKVDFSFTAYELINEFGEKLGSTIDTFHKEPINYEDMLKKKATLGCSTVIIRRTKFCDFRMPLIRTGQDYAFWLSILKSGTNAHAITEVLAQYRIMPNSISRNKFKKALRQWEIYRSIENLSLIRTLNYFSYYAYRAIFRK